MSRGPRTVTAWLIAMALLSSCRTAQTPRGCWNTAGWPVSASSLVQRVTRDEAKRDFLKATADGLPDEFRRSQERSFDTAWTKAFASLQEGDEVWSYAEEKGAGSGWWRKGYIAFHGCSVVGELTTWEDN